MELGKKLQQLRKENHMSQEKLAEHLNVSRQAISKWEQGTVIPDTENIVRISRFFQVPIEFLLLDKYDTIDDLSHSDIYDAHMTSNCHTSEKTTITEAQARESKRILIIGFIIEVCAVFGCYVMQWYELTLFNCAYTNALIYLFKMPVILLVLIGGLCLLRGYCKVPLKTAWKEVWENATNDAPKNNLDYAENAPSEDSENDTDSENTPSEENSSEK